MSIEAQRIQQFVDYVHTLKGDEKGEAQVFCDRLFQAFGHKGFHDNAEPAQPRSAVSLSHREDLIGQKSSQPTRWVIDFGQRDVFAAQS